MASAFGLTFAFPDYLKAVFTDVFATRLPEYNGDDSWSLPLPARLVVDRTGVVRYAKYDPDYTVRPEPEETLAAVRALGSAG